MRDEDVETALALLVRLRQEDGEIWGEVAADFQREDARAALTGKPPYNFWTRPRGGSKTSDCAAICLAVMLAQAPPGAQLYVFASDQDQARLVLDALSGFVDRTPGLSELIDVHAFRARVRETGVTLHISAADAPGSWGLRPYLVILDELAQWPETQGPRQLFDAVRTSVVKMGARLIIITTAGDPTHFSYEIRTHAEGDPLWRLNEVRGPVPWISQDLLDEQRRALPDATYRRLHLNEWVPADDRLTTLHDLEEATQPWGSRPPKPGVRYSVGLDLGITRDRSVMAVCHVEPTDRDGASSIVVVDLVHRWQGTRDQPVMLDQVRDVVLETVSSYNRAAVTFDPYQAEGLGQQLRQRGVRADAFHFSATSNNRLATTLHVLLRNRRLHIPDDAILLDELSRVGMAETRPGQLRLVHKGGQHDDQAVAIALAATRALEDAERPGPRLRALIAPQRRSRFSGFN